MYNKCFTAKIFYSVVTTLQHKSNLGEKRNNPMHKKDQYKHMHAISSSMMRNMYIYKGKNMYICPKSAVPEGTSYISDSFENSPGRG